MLTMQVMACMGIIIGLFLLLGINLTDFTGNIFKRLLDGPKGIREEILEQTQRKKKSFLRREVEDCVPFQKGCVGRTGNSTVHHYHRISKK